MPFLKLLLFTILFMNRCTDVSLKSCKLTGFAIYFNIVCVHFIVVFKILGRDNIWYLKNDKNHVFYLCFYLLVYFFLNCVFKI